MVPTTVQRIQTLRKGQPIAALCFLLLSLALTACGGQPKSAGKPAVKSSAVQVEPFIMPPLSKAEPYGPVENMDEEPQPIQLKGMTAQELSDLLGDPNLRRIDPPAQLWQYMGKNCVLLIFLYDLEKTGHFKVHHLQARSRTKEAEGICVPSLIAEKQN